MSSRVPYEAPKIRDLGDLAQITADVHHVTMGVAQVGGLSSPMTPPPGSGGGGGGANVATTVPPPTPDVSDTSPGSEGPIGFADTSPGDAQGGGGDTPGTGTVPGDTTGGRLPFTGLPVAMIAAMGGVMSAAGAAIRRSLRRDSE